MSTVRRLQVFVCAWLCCACSSTNAPSEPPARVLQRGMAGSTAGAVASEGFARTAGAVAPPPAAAAGMSAVTTPPSSAGAAMPSAGRASPPPAAMSGNAGAPASTPPTLPMMSSGCGKTDGMTGAFQGMIKVADLDRGYYLSVPTPYDANKAHRLVFGYHGSNYTGKMMRQYLDNEKPPLLDNSIFVYPDGLPLPNEPDNVAWVLDPNGRDIAFHDALYTYLTTTYCIDTTRVFVNGQSYGGLMTDFIGCQRGDTIRAIAVVAGSGPYSKQCQGKVAVWLTHGMDDMDVPFSAGEASRDFWVAANGCSNMTVPGMPEQCQVYQGCDPDNPVIWCPHVNDGGHQTPSFGRMAYRVFLASF